MDCSLCRKPIKRYNPELNRLRIDDSLSVDICSECIDKFLRWQQCVFARLFPTKALKKRYGKGQR